MLSDLKIHYHLKEISFTVVLLILNPRNSTRTFPELQLTQRFINGASRQMEIITKRYNPLKNKGEAKGDIYCMSDSLTDAKRSLSATVTIGKFVSNVNKRKSVWFFFISV